MKNFLKRKKLVQKTQEDSPSRITNETVAEHREKVLAGGRKFKYPVQYQKHKLVVNSIVIGGIAVVFLTLLGWHQLYIAENSSKLMYRITQLIPVRVASVDGEPVRYSDYLMRYASAVFYMQKQDAINLSTENGKRQAAYYQREELTNAERSAYVSKLARENKLTVSDKEINDFIRKDIVSRGVSLNAYERTVLNSYYDWSLDEYKSIVRSELLKRKVSFAVDTSAKQRATDILKSLKDGADFASTAKTSSDDTATKANGGDSGALSVSNLDPNGLIANAQQLSQNQVSDVIQGVDGYYIIQLLSKDNSTVRYRLIKIKTTELEKRFEALQKSGKIKEYIKVEEQK